MTEATESSGEVPRAAITRNTAYSRRVNRAHTEEMIVLPEADVDGHATGMYRVVSGSGSTYRVEMTDLRTCSCPDVESNDPPACKHRIRTALEVRDGLLPEPGEKLTEEDRETFRSHQRELRARLALRRDRGYPDGSLVSMLAGVDAALAALRD